MKFKIMGQKGDAAFNYDTNERLRYLEYYQCLKSFS